MALANFASHLNLYSDASSTNKFDLDVLADKALLTVDKDLEIVTPALKLGAVADVEAAITAVQADLLSNASTAASAANTVQLNLDTYKTSNDAAVGALQSALSTEVAQRQGADATQATNLTAESSARQAADTQLAADISAEASARAAALTAEAFARASAIASEAATRASAVSTLTSAVNVEKLRIDSILSGSSIDLDSLKEVVDSFQAADSTLLGTLTALQAQVTTLEARLDSITDP